MKEPSVIRTDRRVIRVVDMFGDRLDLTVGSDNGILLTSSAKRIAISPDMLKDILTVLVVILSENR